MLDFIEKDGRLTQRFFGAHTYRRTVFYEDWTGEETIRVLMDQVSQRKIEIIDNIYITKLLKSDDVNAGGPVGQDVNWGEVTGAFGINIEKKEFLLFECMSLILATGGYTRVYSVSSSRIFENYGDGVALAYEAGADLVDMEMVQFHPTEMVWPEKAVEVYLYSVFVKQNIKIPNFRSLKLLSDYFNLVKWINLFVMG